MLSQYFGFKEEPFGFSPDPRCLYLSRTHHEAIEALEDGFKSNRGFTAMIAPPGMGKTTLLFRFLEDVRESACAVFLFDLDATCEPREFVAYVLRDLGIVPAQGSAEMHQQLSEAVIKENMAGRKFVIVIDEAQNLSEAVLERVRLLTNFENSRGKLIQVVLSGQPQLSDKLLRSSLIQLRQRISTVCHIEPLAPHEIAGYIDYRVKMSGYLGRPLFSEDAIKLIAEASQGTPRTINNLCYNALALCAKMMSRQVDAAIVAKVVASLQLVPESDARAAAAVDVPAAAEVAAQPRKRREFGGLRLAPEPGESAPAERKKPATEPSMPKFWERTRLRLVSFASATAGNVMIWVPAAAIMLVISFVGIVRITEVLSPPAHQNSVDQTTDVSPPPSDTDDPGATESTSPDGSSTPVAAPAAAPVPMRAAAVPRSSPMTATPATSVPMPSASSAPSVGATGKSFQGSAAIPMAAGSSQPLAMAPQTNLQPPAANTSATPAAPQQTSAPPVASAPKQVHAALIGDAPQSGATGTAPSVRPALPQR